MKRVFKSITYGVSTALAISLIFVTGMSYQKHLVDKKEATTVSQPTTNFDLKLLGETEKCVVTVDEVRVKLQDVGEISSCEGNYHVNKGKNFTRYLIDKIPVAGTTNHVELSCDGIVKVGYKIEDVGVSVDDNSKRIYISLPEIQINSNQLIWDESVQYTEKNNILNPIDFQEYQDLIKEIKDEGLIQAEKDGLYQKAEGSAKSVITNFLGCFEGYEVVFL